MTDDDYYDEDDQLVEWYDDYKQRKANKAEITKELSHLGSYPSRWLE